MRIIEVAGGILTGLAMVTMARCTGTPLPDGRVRQMGEGSADGRKTWQVR